MRRRWFVKGRVQGVFFRVETRAEAHRIQALVGFVRNLCDGRVEVEAEGSEQALAALESWLRTGPPRASVSSLEEVPPSGTSLGEFAILADTEAG